MSIKKLLNNPHPFIFNSYSVLVPSFITFLILVILKPFEFATFQTGELIIWSTFFSALVGSTILLCISVVKRYFHKTIEENWMVKSEILLILFVLMVICLTIYTVFMVLNPETNKFELFSLVVLRTLAISFFPVLILVLFEQNRHQNSKRQQAEKFNQELLKSQTVTARKKANPDFSSKIVLLAENKKVALQIAPVDIIFIMSESNYVEVHYRHNQGIGKELIRNSLKSIEEQLPATDFFRCHKRFIINVYHIQKVEGNARNLELILENVAYRIPVSRNKSEQLVHLFQK